MTCSLPGRCRNEILASAVSKGLLYDETARQTQVFYFIFAMFRTPSLNDKPTPHHYGEDPARRALDQEFWNVAPLNGDREGSFMHDHRAFII